MEAGRRRDYTRALELFLEWEARGQPRAWLWIGRSLLALQRRGEAISAFLTHLARFPRDGEGHLHLGRAYLQSGLYRQAIRRLETARSLGESHPYLEALLGWAYLKDRRPEHARIYLQAAVERNPQHRGIYQAYLNALLIWGISAFRREDYLSCRNAMTFLRDNGRSTFLVRLYLAASLRELGELSPAYSLYRELVVEQPEDLSLILTAWELAIRLQRWAEADELLKVAQRVDPLFVIPTPTAVHALLAWRCLEKGQYQRAIQHALTALKIQRDPTLHAVIGQAYYHLGSLDKAINHLKRAVEGSQDKNLWMGLIRYLWEKREWQDCRIQCLKFRQRYPEVPEAEYYLILSSAKLDRAGEDHLKNLQSALRRWGQTPQILGTLGEVFSRRGQSDQARIHVRKSLDLDPEQDEILDLALRLGEVDFETLSAWKDKRRRLHVDLNLELARQSLGRGKPDMAKELSLEILRRQPGHDAAWEVLAEAERQLGDYATAFAIWVRQVRRSPRDRKALLHAFYLLYRMNQPQRAERFKLQVLQKLKDSALHFSFAKAYEKLGLWEQAVLEYEEYLSLHPHDTTARRCLENARRNLIQSR